MASITCTFLTHTPKEIIICGSKGRIKVHGPLWCSEKISLNVFRDGKEDQKEEQFDFPLPKPKEGESFNFTNSIGLQFEANHFQKLFLDGKKESDILPLHETLTIMKTIEEIKKQVNLKYPTDK